MCLWYLLLIFIVLVVCAICFFFKQKTAYEMRISDWSSDVCSSDLATLELLLVRLDPHRRTLDRLGRVLVLHSQVEPILLRQAVEGQAADRLALSQAGTAVGPLRQQLPAQAGVDRDFGDGRTEKRWEGEGCVRPGEQRRESSK